MYLVFVLSSYVQYRHAVHSQLSVSVDTSIVHHYGHPFVLNNLHAWKNAHINILFLYATWIQIEDKHAIKWEYLMFLSCRDLCKVTIFDGRTLTMISTCILKETSGDEPDQNLNVGILP